jgi:tRNA 2-selenouridine synthase
LVLCWRGGQRSGSMTYVLRRVGWDAQQLEGGYKTYRRLVIESLSEVPRSLRLKVICGATGSGKSRILQAIGQLGEQVLDLEDLACHKGSVLGVLPDCPQPSQKNVRIPPAHRAARPVLADRPVYVEAESRKIGSLQLPSALIERMRAGECVNIEASFDARVDFLLRDYAYFLVAPGFADCPTGSLATSAEHGNAAALARYISNQGALARTLVGELLALHYDPLYQRSQKQNYAGYRAPLRIGTDDLTPAGIDALARRVCGR